jgi:hypothetical protein
VDTDTPVLGSCQGFDKHYEDLAETLCAIEDIPIATVHVKLDCSKKGWLLVLALFKSWDGVWATAKILVNNGAMANFVSNYFFRRHDLPLHAQKTLICCVGFAGRRVWGA